MSDSKNSFWTSLPGILTGFAGVISAIAGLIAVWPDSSVSTVPDISPSIEQQVIVKPMVKEIIKTKPTVVTHVAAVSNEKAPSNTGNVLVDCNTLQVRLMSDKSIDDLQGTASFYYKKAMAATSGSNWMNNVCVRFIDYQGAAWCRQPGNKKIADRLEQGLALCAADI